MVGSAVARMVESVFSMKSAVATTNGTIGMTMASGLARMRRRPCAQHLSAPDPTPGNFGRDGIGGAERHIAPAFQPLEGIGQRPGGAVAAQSLVEARELGRSTFRPEHVHGLAGHARLAGHVDGIGGCDEGIRMRQKRRIWVV